MTATPTNAPEPSCIVTFYHDVEQDIDSEADPQACRDAVRDFLELERRYDMSVTYNVVGRHKEGLAVDRRLVELLPLDARVRYNLACSCALAGTYQEALAALEDAVRLGFRDVNLMRKDHDLDALRDDPRYIAIESRIAGTG